LLGDGGAPVREVTDMNIVVIAVVMALFFSCAGYIFFWFFLIFLPALRRRVRWYLGIDISEKVRSL